MMDSQTAVGVGPDGTPMSGAVLQMTVSDPKKESEGINSYISYKVNTQTNLPEFQYGQFSVIRRYSDFVWLAERLARDVPGAIVPPLPEKAVVGRFGADFVESRRRLLQIFLARVGQHDELAASRFFKLFLSADDAGLAACKAECRASDKAEAARLSSAGGRGAAGGAGGLAGVQNWFEETYASINASMAATQTANAAKNEEDERIEAEVAYVSNLETQMQNVAKHTTGLAKRNRDLANGLFEFGLAFTLLGQTEHEPLAGALTKLGHTADQLSLLATESVGREQATFEEPIYDAIRMLGSVKSALGQRQKHKHALALARADLDQKKQAVAKLAGQPGKEDRVAFAEHAVDKAKQDVEKARDDFEAVSARVVREVERFKGEKARDLKAVVVDFCALQMEHHKRLQEQWTQLLPDLESVDVGPDPTEYFESPPPLPPPPPPTLAGIAGGRADSFAGAPPSAPPIPPRDDDEDLVGV